MNKILIWIGFFHGFTQPLSFISYLVGYKTFYTKLSITELFFLFYIISLVLIYLVLTTASNDTDYFYVLNSVRFYFGFLLFYFYFKNGDFKLENIYLFLILIIIVEAFLVNTIIEARYLPNYPEYYVGGECKISNVTGKCITSPHFASEGFPYQRPYSFASMANVTGPLLVGIFSLIRNVKRIHTLILIGVILIIMSGTGFIALSILLIFRREIYLLLFCAVVFAIINFLVSDLPLINIFKNKFSIDSIIMLIKVKFYQLSSFYLDPNDFYQFVGDFTKDNTGVSGISKLFSEFNIINHFFGGLLIISDQGSGYGGDFGWLWLYLSYGFISLLVFILFVISKLNKRNFIPAMILLISTFHYPVIFYLTGQIVFAYILTRSENSN